MRALVSLCLLVSALAAAPGKLYLTDFGRYVLAKTDLVVRARVASVQPAFRGITTARLKVTERLDGYDRASEIVLMYVDDLSAPDAFGASLERASVKVARGKSEKGNTSKEQAGGPKSSRRLGVRLAKGEEAIFFLRRKGATYALLNLIAHADPLFEAKHKRLKEVLRIEAVLALDLRAKNAKKLFFQGLTEKEAWPRGNSARELVNLAARFPDLFSKEDTKRLVALLNSEREKPIQRALELAVRALDPDAALAFARRVEERDRQAFSERLQRERERIDKLKVPELKASDIQRTGRLIGRGATGLVALYLDDDEPIVRERAAQTLAETGGPSCRVALREALADEKDANAAGAMIYALGVHRDADAVDVVAKRLDEKAIETIAVNALAKINTKAARDVLTRHKDKASGPIAELIASLLESEPSRSK